MADSFSGKSVYSSGMDAVSDTIRTLRGESEGRLKVLGSIFLGSAAPVRTPAEAEAFIRRVSREHHDATHHCYAWRLGPRGDRSRVRDDGEPGGTAGRPILAAIEHAGLTDLVVVVTRWFGGTKLGAGGLARAYGRTAETAIAAGEVLTRHVCTLLRVSFPHDRTNAVMHAIALAGARVTGTSYGDGVEITLEIRRSRAERLREALADASRGTAGVTREPEAGGETSG